MRGQPDADMLLTLCELYGVTSIAEFYGEPQPAFSLSSDEMRLIEIFRNLNPEGKEYILQSLDMASKVYKKSDCVSSLEEQIG